MTIQDLWYRKNFFSYLLWPFSGCYRGVIALRRCLYRLGIKKTVHFSAPIIVVGNITVGGTGKTPLVIALAQWLKQQGWRPGLVSRGYGGSATQSPQVVKPDSDPALVGDEPILLVRKTECPMVVGKDRVAATARLLQDYDCNLVISDDGLQHLALGRDLEIAVIDNERGLGNGFCLPAGPLREPPARLNTVDFVVETIASSSSPVGLRGIFFSPPSFQMPFQPGEIYQLINPSRHLTSGDLHGKTLHAVAGIGHPQRFFNTLETLGFKIIPHAFPDHYFFQPSDLDFGANSLIILTEKDAIKCRSFADPRFWCLPISVSLPTIFQISFLKQYLGIKK